MTRLLLIPLTLVVLSGCGGASLTEESEEAQMRPVTIQVPRNVNGITLVVYANQALDLDRVSVKNIKVAVVSSQSIVALTKAGMRALATQKKDVSAKQKVLSDMAADLRAQDAYKEKMREFNDELKARHAELVQEYTEKIQKITGRVASMNGIDLVLDTFGNSDEAKAHVPLPVLELMRRPTKNLTLDVIHEFDRTYK